MVRKALHVPCSQEATELVGEKMRNQAIKNQCKREVSAGCYGNIKRGHSCCSSGSVVAGEKGGMKQTDLLARPSSAQPGHSAQPGQLVQDESFWHDKTCQLLAPALPHLRN